MRTKIILCAAVALVMSALPILYANFTERAVRIIDYTTGGSVVTVSPPAEEAYLSSDIPMPGILSVYDAARDVTFQTDTEEYIIGVVAAEMPASFHTEALKAQAVAARSYMLYKMTNHPASHKGGASVCTDLDCCKAYLSYEDATRRWTEEAAKEMFETIRTAVTPVRGVIMTFDGAVACALFHSSSFGMTESAVNVWGGDLSYLHAVSTPETNVPVTVSFTAEETAAILNRAGWSVTGTEDPVITLNDTGRVDSVAFGGVSVPGTKIRNLFGLRSTLFTVEKNTVGYRFTCMGYGHGVGMSQYGADALADQGYTYDEILRYYYKGISLCAAKTEFK